MNDHSRYVLQGNRALNNVTILLINDRHREARAICNAYIIIFYHSTNENNMTHLQYARYVKYAITRDLRFSTPVNLTAQH